MPESFDPYYRWLGISPKHQPPDHYRLLALEQFESDVEVIRDGAERQMAHVRRYQLGQHSGLSQKILNELAAAKVCLLDSRKKAEYDRRLTESQAAAGRAADAAAVILPPVVPVFVVAEPVVVPQPVAIEPSVAAEVVAPLPPPLPVPPQRNVAWLLPAALVVVALGSILAVALVVVFTWGGRPEITRNGGQSTAEEEAISSDLKKSTSPEGRSRPSDRVPNDSKKPPDVGLRQPAAESPSVPVQPPDSLPTQARRSVVPPVFTTGKTTDLLAAIDPDRDKRSGTWRFDGRSLVADDSGSNFLSISAKLPEEYVFNATVRWTSGKPPIFSCGLPAGGAHAVLHFTAASRLGGSLATKQGYLNERQATLTPIFHEQQENEIDCTVRNVGGLVKIVAACNGKCFVDWVGKPENLLPRSALLPSAAAASGLCLGGDGSFTITKLNLTPLPPAKEPAPSLPLTLANSRPVDLLKSIDAQRDAIKGEWRIGGQGLLAPFGSCCRLQIPCQPPAEYTLTVAAERKLESGALVLGLVAAGRQVTLQIDSGSGAYSVYSVLERVAGIAYQNRQKGRVLIAGKTTTIACTVREKSISVTADGAPLLVWSGNPQSFALGDAWQVPSERQLFVGAHDASFQISKLELSLPGPLTGVWASADDLYFHIADDGKTIRIQLGGETTTLRSLAGSLSRTDKAEVLEGEVRAVFKRDTSQREIGMKTRLVLKGPDTLTLRLSDWPIFDRNGRRIRSDTATPLIKELMRK